MDELEQIRAEVLTCRKCTLCETRHNPVFGEGNRHAPVMCIGEGPGYYEDMAGKPFVGKSGELLDKIFLACGFTRDKHVFIANIVKCRPPENRNPKADEMAACLPYLYRQIELVDPKIIILLGSTALKGLIDPNARITRLRGQWLEWQNRWVMPTYHPSALLRNPELKRDAWEDFKKVIDKYRETVDPAHYSKYH
ncbi:MAG: uracil-DNA glycosylase [Bacteroidales bacterium]|jgi:DNA polymerase|nr:uracil-DNA glycosylase [Bacteroidales bacterium]MCI2122121.1 uracil-DNA glycosylase [Bacteroidales bacterium]MCI2145632.1 uracil-DNA glycosylase [Bacteroidales bacterium]